MRIKQLKQFLVKAKISTYASSGEGGEKILFDGSKELEFKEGNLRYRDRYFGFNPFIGEEVVFYKDKPIWGMNYYGKVTCNDFPAKKIYQFLQKVLREVREDKPFRGPDQFKKDGFEYVNKVNGDVNEFQGVEKIFAGNKEVYKLDYHGGLINGILPE